MEGEVGRGREERGGGKGRKGKVVQKESPSSSGGLV